MGYKNIKNFSFNTKFLYVSKKKINGRSNVGHIILLGRGGGFKKFYRLIDFKRLLLKLPAKIIRYEFDPNRNVYIILILYINGLISYLLAPLLVKINMFILTELNPVGSYWNGINLPLINYPIGSFLHCMKMYRSYAQFVRSAGTFFQIIRKLGDYVLVKLPSREQRFIFSYCFSVLGRLANHHIKLTKRYSAGVYRRLGYKPHVRGVAKNPVDHPHGGGEGRTTAGQPSVTPFGLYTKGRRTSTRFQRPFIFLKIGFFKRRSNTHWYR